MRIVARPGTPGVAEGKALLWGGRGPSSLSVSGRILILPKGEVSERGLFDANAGPVGVVTAELTPSLARPLASARIPSIQGAQPEAFLEGDQLKLDGGAGMIELEGVVPTEVVTAILRSEEGHVLLLHRSERVGSFQGYWAGVSGYLESLTPLERALVEIEEEVGLGKDQVRLVHEGAVVYARDRGRMFVVHPFLFAVEQPAIRIDWEHTEYRWVPLGEVARFKTVPGLERVFVHLDLEKP